MGLSGSQRVSRNSPPLYDSGFETGLIGSHQGSQRPSNNCPPLYDKEFENGLIGSQQRAQRASIPPPFTHPTRELPSRLQQLIEAEGGRLAK